MVVFILKSCGTYVPSGSLGCLVAQPLVGLAILACTRPWLEGTTALLLATLLAKRITPNVTSVSM